MPDDIDRKKREKAIAEFFNYKMERLEKFYRFGLSEVGWNKYSYINIEFDNQIICRKCKSERVDRTAEPTPAPVPANSQEAATPARPYEDTATANVPATTENSNATNTEKKAKSDATHNDVSANKTAKTEKTAEKTTEKKKSADNKKKKSSN